MTRWIAMLPMLLFACPAWTLEVKFEPVAQDVYAYVGDKGPRSIENEGLNANIGLVVTRTGAVLIDSGATFHSARKIDDGIRKITAQPVRWVINTGGQDHRWLGNGYFKARGAEIIAHVSAAGDMQSRGGDQLIALRSLLGDRVDGTVPTLPTRLLASADTPLELGGVKLEIRHRGGGHTPGDVLVWLPQAEVLFTGDVVYVERLPGIIPVTSSRRWLESFAELERLAPRHVVPGHGGVTDVATAKSHTRDYLSALRTHMRLAVDGGKEIADAVRTFDSKPWMQLINAAELMAGNANRAYLEMEQE